MSFTDKTAPNQTGAITFEAELRHAPEKVWRALTNPVLLAEWLLPAVGFDLSPGAKFQFQAPAQPGWDGVVHCELLDAVEPSTLRYAWKVGELNTVVTFTLTPQGDGTLLVMEQSGFTPEQKQNFGGARYGWRLMGGRLLKVLGRETT